MAKKTRKRKWAFGLVMEEASKYKSRGAFAKGSPGAYNAALRNPGWMDATGLPAHKWTDETLRAEARKYRSRGEFLMHAENAWRAAFNKGMLDELFPKK